MFFFEYWKNLKNELVTDDRCHFFDDPEDDITRKKWIASGRENESEAENDINVYMKKLQNSFTVVSKISFDVGKK